MKLPKVATLALLLSLGLIAFGCQEKKEQPASPEKEDVVPTDDSMPQEEKADQAIDELKDKTSSLIKEGASQTISFYDDTPKEMKDTMEKAPDMDDVEKTVPDTEELKEKAKKQTPTEEDVDDGADKVDQMKDTLAPMGDR